MSEPARTAGRRSPVSLPDDRASAALLVSGAITALTLGTAFGLLALDVEHFWIVFPLGFGVVLPTALGVVTYRRAGTDGQKTPSVESARENPLEALRTQYARGEVSDAEFERRLDRLIENDDAEYTGRQNY